MNLFNFSFIRQLYKRSNHKYGCKYLLGFCILFSFTFHLYAQDASPVTKPFIVNGIVFGSDKLPLGFATVKVKGRLTTTKTDDYGKFTVKAIIGDELIISYTGYKNKSVKVTNENAKIEVHMNEDPNNMDQVVVIGYQSVKKSTSTSDVGHVDPSKLAETQELSFDQVLGGRITGVEVTTADGKPGGYSSIVIRGNVLSQDASPLYVVDGLPIENLDFNSLNMNDIASLDVLKDASSIAIYGSRGANGVILVTTKKGTKGQPIFTYSYSIGFEKVTKHIPLMDPYNYVKMELELDSLNSTPSKTVMTNHYLYLNQNRTLDYYKNDKGYNWQNLILRTGNVQAHNISMSGGTTGTRYRVSGSYDDIKGILINTGVKRYTTAFTLDQKITDKLRLGTVVNYTSTNVYGTNPIQGNLNGVIYSAWSFRPTVGLSGQNLINSITDSINFVNGVVSNTAINPYLQATNEFHSTVSNTSNASVSLDYSLNNIIGFKVTGTIGTTQSIDKTFYNSRTNQGNLFLNASGGYINANGINGGLSNSLTTNKYFEALMSFKKFVLGKKQDGNAIIGFNWQDAINNSRSFTVNNISPDNESLGFNAINNGMPNKLTVNPSLWRLISFFGRVNYTISNKYLFTLTARTDGSSKFAPGKKWGFFPALAFNWKVSQESFMQSPKLNKIISEIRLRSSYGLIGNNRVGDFSYLYQFGSIGQNVGYALNDSTYTYGDVPYFPGNADLTWETSKQFDVSLDAILFKKLSMIITFYDKRSDNTLQLVKVPAFAGYINGGNVRYENLNRGTINSGLEIALTMPFKVGQVFCSIGFNTTLNMNKLVNTTSKNLAPTTTKWGLNARPAWITKIGQSLSSFYGYKWAGVYQYTDFNKQANGTYILKDGIAGYVPTGTSAASVQPGDPKYADINHDGIIDANDQTIIGRADPIFYGGIPVSATYRSFSLNFLVQFVDGNNVLNANKAVFEQGGYANYINQFASYENRWTPNNPTNDIPRLKPNSGGDVYLNSPSSRFIEDGSFVRLKTISLSYGLNPKKIKTIGLNSCRFIIAVTNLLTFTHYSGTDPEASNARLTNNQTGGTGYTSLQPSGSSPGLTRGYDFTPYPRAITYRLGVNVGF